MITANALRRNAFLLLLIGLLAVLVIIPMISVVQTAFVTGVPNSGNDIEFTLSNFGLLFSAKVAGAAINSIVVAVGGTLLATVIGCLLAWLVARTDVPGKSFIHLTGLLPLFISVLVAAVTWSLLGTGNSGYLNIVLADLGVPFRINMRSLGGFIFAEGLYHVPYPFLFTYAALTLVTSDMEDAAAVHGANPLRATRRIVFPLVKPAIFGSMIINLVLMIENVSIPQILGSPVGLETLSIRIYYMMTKSPYDANGASAMALVLAAVVCGLLYAQRWVLGRNDYRTVTGKGLNQRPVALGPWKWLAFGLVVLYFTVSIVLPVLALLLGSFRANMYIPNTAAFFDVSQLSTTRLMQVLSNREIHAGFINSLIVASTAAILGTALCFAIAYVVTRTRLPGRQMLEYVAMLPLAIPALLLAMGTLWLWVGSPLPIYGTVFIIILAFIPRFMPQGYRAIASSISQIHDDLEDAALICGATRMQTVRRIIVPLLRGGIFATVFLLFVLGLREVGAALFLSTTYTRVLSIMLLESYESGTWDYVASLSLLYSLLLGVITLVGRRWMTPSL
ncbi:ABC transporter permease [Inquilinus sp. CA228]|uniref:ABC transporter permease n=1 Tax=Inquilinus sp. CA228 TaxID=3455609 RepID=UPI003F8CFAA5